MSDCPLHHSHFDYDPNPSGSSAILRCKGCGGLWPEVLPGPGGAAIMHVATQHQDIQGLLRAEIDRLRAEVERLTCDFSMLVHKNEPEPYALHYDECPYKPFADLPRWEEPENAPSCTCSELHKAAYWKARWILIAGWRKIAERKRDEALAQVVVLVEELEYWHPQVHTVPDDCEHPRGCGFKRVLGNYPSEARALLDRLQRAEAVVLAVKQYREHFTALSVVGADGTKDIAGVPREVHEAVLKALAAWEEGGKEP